jgi:hypothetical protein
MNLSDVERDAALAAQVMAGLAAQSAVRTLGIDDGDRTYRELVEEGHVAAQRVLAYLRALHGPGDGAAAAVPSHLAPWREWCPPRGHLLRAPQDRVPRRCHGDPGE